MILLSSKKQIKTRKIKWNKCVCGKIGCGDVDLKPYKSTQLFTSFSVYYAHTVN